MSCAKKIEEPGRNSRMVLRILQESPSPLGSRRIAGRMQELGVPVSERGVRYHLKMLDERGFTRLIGRKDGRVITDAGLDELARGGVRDKVGLSISRIENMAFRTTFDPLRQSGLVPVNISIIPKSVLKGALETMAPVFEAGLAVSDKVALLPEGLCGTQLVPAGHVGLITVCSIVFNGVLLRNAIPMESKFGGILQMEDRKPARFTELIHYSGSSLDPSEAFIRASMTKVGQAARSGRGMILANYREVPEACLPELLCLAENLKRAGITGLMAYGTSSEALCMVPVNINRVGVVLIGGLNPLAALHESGIAAENKGMAEVMAYEELISFKQLAREQGLKI